MTGLLIKAVLAGLAGYRVAVFAVEENGPGNIALRVRDWAGVPRYIPGQLNPSRPRPFFAGVLSCVWCASVHATAYAWGVGQLLSWQPVAVVAAMALPVVLSGTRRGESA